MFTKTRKSLLTKALRRRFEKVGCQENTSDPLIIAKFFNPCGAGTWYVSEYLPEEKLFFGYVTDFGFDEWGYSSLEELEAIKCPPFNLSIERDRHFQEAKFSTITEIHRT